MCDGIAIASCECEHYIWNDFCECIKFRVNSGCNLYFNAVNIFNDKRHVDTDID